MADIEQAYISSASCILANLSIDLDRTLAWDSVSNKVSNDAEANARLARRYRSPWKHPAT